MVTFPNAKINIGLHITGRRPDGYHNLETLFYPVTLADILEVVPADEFSFRSTGNLPDIPVEQNLVVKAYQLLQRYAALPSVAIHLHKVIPSGAGLGGGSSDAAFMLKMVNEQFNLGFSDSQLSGFAGSLGADCPFFILNKPALATGTGDILEPLPIDLSAFSIVLVKPPFPVSTAQAFRAVNPVVPETSLAERIRHPVETWKNSLTNDFEKPVFQMFPEIGRIKEKLYSLGALYASMSGSGSSVYGIFSEIPVIPDQTFPPDYFCFTEQKP